MSRMAILRLLSRPIGVLQYVAVCCSVLQCVAVYVAVCIAVSRMATPRLLPRPVGVLCCSVLQRVAVCCSVCCSLRCSVQNGYTACAVMPNRCVTV